MTGSSLFFIILGAVAFLQVCFLPGWLISHFLKLKDSLARQLVVSFGLSLMVNYWIIFILASLHLYTHLALGLIFIIEIGIWIAIRKQSKTGFDLKEGINWLREEFERVPGKHIKIIIAVLTTATLAYLGYLFIDNIGTIFKLSDSVTSWNRWAVEWSTNMLPQNTWEYPQLIPANWSVFYTFLGQPLEYFSKAIMPLFPIGIVLILLLTGIKKKSWGYIAAVPATILIMRLMVGSELMATEGYVDTAVAFFGIVSFLSLIWAQDKKNLLTGAIFAVGALMTKQAGLLVVIMYPIAAWFLVLKDNKELRKNILRDALIYIGLIIILAGPFFIYKQLSISSAQDVSVVPTIANLIYTGDKSPIAVAAYALYFLIGKTHGLIVIYLALLVVSLGDRKYRIFAIIAVIYSIIWAFFNSYDTRNLTLSLPFWSLAAGSGIERLFLFKENFLNKFVSKIKPAYILIIIILCAIVVSPWVGRKVTEKYNQDKQVMYDESLSILLNNYFSDKPEGKIFTNFSALYFFPLYKDRIHSLHNGYSNTKSDFENYFTDSLDPKVSYVLAAPYSDKIVFEDLENKIKEGRFTLGFKHNGYILVKTNNK